MTTPEYSTQWNIDADTSTPYFIARKRGGNPHLIGPGRVVLSAFLAGAAIANPAALEAINDAFTATTSGWVGFPTAQAMGTTSGEFYGAVPSEATATSSDLVRALRDESALTWEQLSKLFGVSRRTLHMWSAGSAMNAAHQERLGALLRTFRSLPANNPEDRRSQILAPQGAERSIYDRLRAEAARSERVSRSAYSFSSADALALDEGHRDADDVV